MKWTDVPSTTVLAAANLCDGHSIFGPELLLEAGVPQELVDRHTSTYESDFSNPKYVIFDNKTGEPVKEMKGVYGLNVLSGIVSDLGLEAPEKFGRGFQAQVWKDAIQAHFDPKPAPATA